ncbi:matrix metalloproteinase-20-like isoform X2 [Sebastes umbrosus]|uniref:matrix metalloproteinase-20-like isoform X2 n=1 Tax=Sebastes umbrosus TaxID=72105 RepID=UPI00189CBE46|nr:matrix metalloproteinase-20-like isoform X2 [Sebastes umbrosus]
MELFWLWIPVLGSLMLAELLWTLPIDQDQGPRPEDEELAEDYLRRFYNLNPRGRESGRGIRSTSAAAMEEKIREMQNFFGLRETGGLDSTTLDVMREPRCGVPDVENFSFYPERPKWKNHTITYMIARFTPDMTREDVEKSFRSALKMWSDAAPLRFIRVNHGKTDIVFTFARRTHGDFFPFDGPRGVLAHAFQPGEGIGGDVHFDEDETWTAGRQGYSLFAVAAHELGHSLGLTHSKDPSAIMYPNYRYHSRTQYSLSKDDVLGIQTLYGKPSRKETQAAPKKCDPNFTFDAAAMIGNEIVFFKNRYDERSKRMDPGFPRHIQTDWPGIPRRVDAAFKLDGSIFLFSGTKSYQYDFRRNKVVNTISANSWLGC